MLDAGIIHVALRYYQPEIIFVAIISLLAGFVLMAEGGRIKIFCLKALLHLIGLLGICEGAIMMLLLIVPHIPG